MRAGWKRRRRSHVVWSKTGCTSASLKDVRRSHYLRTCAPLDFTLIQCNTAHTFLNHSREAENNAPQVLKEKEAVRGWHLWNPQVHFPERMEICFRDWLKDRWGDGELLGMVLACSLLGSRGGAGSHGKGGLWGRVLCPPPKGWDPVNKNLFSLILIVGSYVKVPSVWAPVCLVPHQPLCSHSIGKN